MKKTRYGLVAVLAMLVGLGGGIVLGHDEPGSKVGGGTVSNKEIPLAPPSILDANMSEENVATQEVVRANKFELMDKQGKIRAVLGMSPDGEPRLALADSDGQILAALSVEIDPKYAKEKFPKLRFFDRTGKVRNEIGLNRYGDPTMVLYHEEGKLLASLNGTRKIGTELILGDENGRPRLVLNVNQAGTHLSFFDEAGKARTIVGLKRDGSPSLVFSDEKMKNRVVLGYVDSTSTQKNSKEQQTVSSLALFDKDGKVLWKAP